MWLNWFWKTKIAKSIYRENIHRCTHSFYPNFYCLSSLKKRKVMWLRLHFNQSTTPSLYCRQVTGLSHSQQRQPCIPTLVANLESVISIPHISFDSSWKPPADTRATCKRRRQFKMRTFLLQRDIPNPSPLYQKQWCQNMVTKCFNLQGAEVFPVMLRNQQ